ncbi:MAG: GGDEF domain-containing protein [Planctomycetota bacterium]
MSGFASVNFSNSEQGLFTPEEIHRLMRIEFERAVRYDYPIVCTLIEVDRLESLHDLYGVESKEEILNSVIGLLRSMTRASDFLGCMRDDRLMVIFPHTPRTVAGKLAERLLTGARKLRFDSDGRTLRTTLSIGISYCEESERISFEEFLKAAEDALQLAVQGGGDRYLQRPRDLHPDPPAQGPPMPDLAQAQAQAQAQALAQAGLAPPGVPVVGQARVPLEEVQLEELPDTPLGDKLRLLFQQLGPQTPETAATQHAIIDLTLKNLELARTEAAEKQLEERNKQVDTLERRVRKLASMLDMTESELKRVAAMKSVDPGVASIYRSVQGLSGEEKDYEMRKQLMHEIFKANIELKKQRESASGS